MNEALDRVKIGEFIKRGGTVRGVVHIGTNDGYEIQWYLQLGLSVVGFEPLPEAFAKCRQTYLTACLDGRCRLLNYAIGRKTGVFPFFQTDNKDRPGEDSGGSSFLREKQPHEHIVIKERYALMLTYTDFLRWSGVHPEDYNCLVVDVQGMELEVLQSIGKYLTNFEFLNIECSEVPWYDGEAAAQEVIDYLARHGFQPITAIFPHDDILFERV